MCFENQLEDGIYFEKILYDHLYVPLFLVEREHINMETGKFYSVILHKYRYSY